MPTPQPRKASLVTVTTPMAAPSSRNIVKPLQALFASQRPVTKSLTRGKPAPKHPSILAGN
jgi:hypothetical protein